MSWTFDQLCDLFSKKDHYRILCESKHAFEKECLRTDTSGSLALTPHPEKLGSSFTHPSIITDYSESQLELITRPYFSEKLLLRRLETLMIFVQQNIGDELMWPASMPCRLPEAQQIPLANYGTSHEARVKQIYRRGLGIRYGRKMQTISGIHYNFSFSRQLWKFLQEQFQLRGKINQIRDQFYLHAVRNFLRYNWIITYMCGASPVVDRSFRDGPLDPLEELSEDTWYSQYATSLRMSTFGYQSSVQKNLQISWNSFDEYLEGLKKAIHTPWPEYEKYSLQKGGVNQQLNSNILQVEAEMYAPIRIKQPPKPGERVYQALEKRGIKYLEVRNVDNNPFSLRGIGLSCLHSLHLFMVFCLFEPSPPLTAEEKKMIAENINSVALYGRKPGLKLHTLAGERSFFDLSMQIMKKMEKIAALLDKGTAEKGVYTESLSAQAKKFQNPELTPSAQIIGYLRENKLTFIQFCLQIAQKNREYFLKRRLSDKSMEYFQKLAAESIKKQEEIEKSETQPFEEYLKKYQS